MSRAGEARGDRNDKNDRNDGAREPEKKVQESSAGIGPALAGG